MSRSFRDRYEKLGERYSQKELQRPNHQPRMADGCCHQTVLAGNRCEGCPVDPTAETAADVEWPTFSEFGG